MADDAGLTLVEMLAVLAIIGVAAGSAALSIAPVGRAGVASEARGLARDITRAADATLTGAPARLVIEPGGYVLDGKPHALPDGIVLAPPASIAIDAGAGPAFQLRVARGSEAWRVRFDGLRATAGPDQPERPER